MKSIKEIMDFLLYHRAKTPVKPNVPMYLGNMQRLLNTEQGYITGYWLRQMFKAAVNVLIEHDLVLYSREGSPKYEFIPAKDANLEQVLRVIKAELEFITREPEDVTPGYHADLLHMHLEMTRALVLWERNEWEAYTMEPIVRIAALLVRRTLQWLI